MTDNQLEEKVWYRFLKILYYFSLMLIIIATLLFGWVTRPNYEQLNYASAQLKQSKFIYKDMDNKLFVDTIYKQYYSDMPIGQFYEKIDFNVKPGSIKLAYVYLKDFVQMVVLFLLLSVALDSIKSCVLYIIYEKKLSFPIIKNIKRSFLKLVK